MICFRCGEKNPESYRFCGMCGSPLQASRGPAGAESTRNEPAGQPVAVATPERRSDNFPFSRAEKIAKTAPAAEAVDPIAGPSLLGLNEPTLDSLREKAFSSADETYFEPDDRKPAWGRIFGLVLVVCIVVAAAWWHYSSYGIPGLTASKQAVPQQTASAQVPVNPAPSNTPNANSASPAAENTANGPQEKNLPASTPPVSNAPAASEAAVPPPATASADQKAEEHKPTDPASNAAAATPEGTKNNVAPTENAQPPHGDIASVKPATTVIAKNSPAVPERPAKPAPVVTPDNGDALFKKGEAFLYGRGVPENCDQAMKYLKAASDKSNAKARSTFGTMYATGHCVPRDLPSSYRWFALALRVDPNNQILEKDLSAVWNQMTPPERQLAMKSQ